MRCEQIMRRNIPVVTVEDNAEHVGELMKDENLGFLPIVMDEESNQLVGVITDRDLVLQVVAHNLSPREVRIGDVMTTEVITVRTDDELRDAERKMAEAEIRRLPVVDENRRVVGVLSIHDVAQAEGGERMGQIFREVSKASAQI